MRLPFFRVFILFDYTLTTFTTTLFLRALKNVTEQNTPTSTNEVGASNPIKHKTACPYGIPSAHLSCKREKRKISSRIYDIHKYCRH